MMILRKIIGIIILFVVATVIIFGVIRPAPGSMMGEAKDAVDREVDKWLAGIKGEKIKQQGIVIETCPTSNLLIGGIPNMENHPFWKFYKSRQKVAICTDDPGILNRSLMDEVESIVRSSGIDYDELEERLGDPYRYRLGSSREY